MDRARFDALTDRFVRDAAGRRQTLRWLLGMAASGVGLASSDAVGARARRTHKTRCSSARRCGKACCPQGKICAGGVCVIGQGACPTGADFCAHAIYACGGVGSAFCVCATTTEGDTRCIQTPASSACGSCTTSADCANVGPGAVCIGFGDNCCTPTQGECVTPCLV